MDQGYTFPSRNANNWDTDLNENFRKTERGHVFPGVVGPTTVVSGMLVQWNSSGFIEPYSASVQVSMPAGLALSVTSPGNAGYYLMWGSVNTFAPWSGQCPIGSALWASVQSPGWVTPSEDASNLIRVARCTGPSNFLIQPMAAEDRFVTSTNCGISHAASAGIDVFSFTVFGGRRGINNQLRVLTLSCDNYRVTFFANSGRSDIIYDTAVLSGNLSVRTIDMNDSALWPYSVSNVGSMYGILYGAVQVLSSAATAINCGAFQVQFSANRQW